MKLKIYIPDDCDYLYKKHTLDEPICCYAGFELIDNNNKCLLNHSFNSPDFFGPNLEADIYDWLNRLLEITVELTRNPHKTIFQPYKLDIAYPPFKAFISFIKDDLFHVSLIHFYDKKFLSDFFSDFLPPKAEIYDDFEAIEFCLWCDELLKATNYFLEVSYTNDSLKENIWLKKLKNLSADVQYARCTFQVPKTNQPKKPNHRPHQNKSSSQP